MARGKDLGKDFDDQFDHFQKRAQGKRDRGEGYWADDKKMRDAGKMREPSGNEESCGKATVIMLGLLAGTGWALSEAVSRVI